MKRIIAAAAISLATIGTLTACGQTDAKVVDENLKTAAEQFEVNRRITVVNTFTDKYIMVVEGKCSLEFPSEKRDEIICKLADGGFVKHHVMKGDNVLVMSEQVNGTAADTDRYRVIFKPESIIPNVDVE